MTLNGIYIFVQFFIQVSVLNVNNIFILCFLECIEKIAQSGNKILELEQEVESLKSDIDATKLQQKIIDKKITNAIKQQEKLEEEVNNAKVKRDSLSVEIVDLREGIYYKYINIL